MDIVSDMNALEEAEGTDRRWSHAMIKNVLKSENYIGDYESMKKVRMPAILQSLKGYRCEPDL